MNEKDTEVKNSTPDYNRRDVINALSQFIVRVAGGKATSDKEIEVLPQVTYALMHIVNKGRSY